ncbi:hypothetical protein JDV02_007224 [Purpureocillium takamizusanense]|uniref:Uncharacterized protein n=1 Tax=Purpureocillium takamizusanense TaxID=2060973 RepID=A0A9Q8VDU6_9HYPO|nr:uncharacterized protein JDV02_007224 [Purpureocillium takamizusanense]UNI21214.1 hypothetical protein JDV02_007224 [Purpureocillium takamizusanense]
MGIAWFIELPGGSNPPIGRIMPLGDVRTDRTDVDIENAAPNGERITLRVQGQDIWKLRTNVYMGEKVVMTTKRMDKIVAGMDIALASAIVVFMAATMFSNGTTTATPYYVSC